MLAEIMVLLLVFFFFLQRLQTLKLIYLVSITFNSMHFKGEGTIGVNILTEV